MNSNVPTKQKRIFGYDLIKALAMFLVVFYHTGMIDCAYIHGEFYIPNVNKMIQILAAAGVPLFFMVNGALTVGKNADFRIVITRVCRLIFIAVLWTSILRVGILGFGMGRLSGFTISSFANFYWFFYSLALSYIVNYLIDTSPKWLGKTFLLVLFCLVFVNNFIWDILLCVKPNTTLPSWGHTGFFTLYGVIYTRIGAFLRDKGYRPLISVFLMLIGYGLIFFETVVMTDSTGTLFDGVNGAFPTLGAMFLAIGLFCLLKDIKACESSTAKLIGLVGMNSGGVYVFHHLFIVLIRDEFFGGVMNIRFLPIIAVLFIALFVCLLTAGISEQIGRSPCKFLLKF